MLYPIATKYGQPSVDTGLQHPFVKVDTLRAEPSLLQQLKPLTAPTPHVQRHGRLVKLTQRFNER